MENIQTKIALFKSLFKGREDVFAKRWENDTKSGYMPVYFFDPYRLRAHKMKGGTFQNYTDKTYLQLTDDQIVKHLNGEQVIGLYPLLSDNTSWFIASDFDENSGFDRLFPNQDNLSGKGFGNLIALPLNGISLQQGNSCFIDPISLQPYADQWKFFQQIERVPIEHLEKLFSNLGHNSEPESHTDILTITLKNNIQLNRNAIPQTLFNFIKEELNFLNTEFIIKKICLKTNF